MLLICTEIHIVKLLEETHAFESYKNLQILVKRHEHCQMVVTHTFNRWHCQLVVEYTFNHRTWEEEADRSLSLRSACSTE